MRTKVVRFAGRKSKAAHPALHEKRLLGTIVVVITPPLPRDGDTATPVHAVNLIKIKLEERW